MSIRERAEEAERDVCAGRIDEERDENGRGSNVVEGVEQIELYVVNDRTSSRTIALTGGPWVSRVRAAKS